jgi:hypothetical protein
MAAFAEDVPEHCGTACERVVGDRELLEPLCQAFGRSAGLMNAREVALDVGGEDRDADAAELLGEHLERDGLAGSGGASDEAVAVGHAREQGYVGFPAGDEHGVGHGGQSVAPPRHTEARLCFVPVRLGQATQMSARCIHDIAMPALSLERR